MIVDCFIHSYERDAISVRLRELCDVVTLHVAVQGITTFRHERRRLTPVGGANVIDVAVDFPPGLTPFQCEQLLRDEGLRRARDAAALRFPGTTPRFIVADGDEIPHPDAVREAARGPGPATLLNDYREWFMDWRAPEPWQPEYQPILATFDQIQERGGATLARERCRDWPTFQPRGWHLSTLGDAALASAKLSTFAHAEYDTGEWNNHTQLNHFRTTGRDLLDRFDLEHTTDLPACAGEFPHLLAPTEA